jgi:surfactin synthase thioesterase subunit
MKIIALPFAGGSGFSYQVFKTFLHPFTLQTIEYSGRGRRMSTPLYTRMEAVVEDVYPAILESISGEQEYAIYGHSMGALAGLLVCRRLLAEHRILPRYLVVSGKAGPAMNVTRDICLYKADNDRFWEGVARIGGTPAELMEQQEYRSFFEPILRADFEAVETFVYTRSVPLPVPLLVVYGTEEGLEAEAVKNWQVESVLPVKYYTIPGNHFFIFDYPEEVAAIIKSPFFQHVNTGF